MKNQDHAESLKDPLVESVACDLCDSDASTPLHIMTDTFYDLPGIFVLQKCSQCDSMYLSPRPTRQTILNYYPDTYSNYQPAIEDEPFFLMRRLRRNKLLQRRKKLMRYSGLYNGDLLDVGCSTGLFLSHMAQTGWSVRGVEPVESAATYARNKFNLDVFNGMFLDAPYPPESMDVITFWDVLEHTFSPSAELRQAAALLRPGGLLAISIPNWDSPDRILFRQYWQGLDPPRHLHVFTRKTLTQFLTQAGFDVLAWDCFMPGYFATVMSVQRWCKVHCPRLAPTIARILNLPGMRFPFTPWFTISNWFNKGPLITVFACKRCPCKEAQG